jgi:hypothetical protein
VGYNPPIQSVDDAAKQKKKEEDPTEDIWKDGDITMFGPLRRRPSDFDDF